MNLNIKYVGVSPVYYLLPWMNLSKLARFLPLGSFFFTRSSHSLGCFCWIALITFLMLPFCFSVHFAHVVSIASGRVFLKSDPSGVHRPLSKKQLMYALRSLSLEIRVSTSKLSYLALYFSAANAITTKHDNTIRTLILIVEFFYSL
uniref:Chemosensory protein 10 n=1 Tax=Mythimna separata TaxID=271217 RepID=A0A1V1WCG3_MYTSE